MPKKSYPVVIFKGLPSVLSSGVAERFPLNQEREGEMRECEKEDEWREREEDVRNWGKEGRRGVRGKERGNKEGEGK